MRYNKNNGEELNSGRLFFGKKRTIRDSRKKLIRTELDIAGSLKFKIKTFKRDDFEQYFGIDKKVDLKIKTYNVRGFEESHVIQIDNKFYDIVTIDFDPERRYMFLYLQNSRFEND